MQNTKKQPYPQFKTATFLFIIMFSGALINYGCSENNKSSNNTPVPLGDKQALEQLATNYQELSENLTAAPNDLKPGAKRQFVEQVFNNAGYDYNKTLLQIADNGLDHAIQLHRDLAELVLFPQSGVKKSDLTSYYSASEIKAINILLEKLK